MMQFPNLSASLGRVLTENTAVLLTGGGVLGVIGTAAVSFRAGSRSGMKLVEASREHDDAAARYDVEHDNAGQYPAFDRKAQLKVIWPELLAPAAASAVTIAAVIMSNRVSAKQAAVLAAGYGLAQNQLEEYKQKVLETVGVSKEKKIREALAQEEVNDNPPKGRVLVMGEGLVLCYESLSGRYFQSTVDAIRKAENSVNSQLFHYQVCSLTHFYDELGLAKTELSDGLGWNMVTADHPQLEVVLTAVTTDDEKPCLSLGYNILPKHGYEQTY
jgi:Family of unknown function (DUF6353)